MFASSGSLAVKTVAAADTYQSLVRMPARPLSVRDGPQIGTVVLHAAADVVERLRVVGADAIELRQRQVGEVPPRLHPVVGLAYSPPSLPMRSGSCPSDRRRSRDDRRGRPSAPPTTSGRRRCCATSASAATRSSRDRVRRRRSRCSSQDRRRGSSHRSEPRLVRRQPVAHRPAAAPVGWRGCGTDRAARRRWRRRAPFTSAAARPPPPAPPPRPPPTLRPMRVQLAPASSDRKKPPCPRCAVTSA